MKNQIKIILLLFFIFSNHVRAQQWQGHWTSSFGKMKFIEKQVKPQNAVLVFGNYGKYGTIIGVSIAGQLHGVFYDSKTKEGGPLVFTQSQTTASYTGLWNFEGKQKKLNWNGVKIDNIKPDDIREVDRFRSAEGQWQSNFGLLDFVQDGTFIDAAYSDKGQIFAVYNQVSNIILGMFTNKDRYGLLKLNLNPEKNRFDGLWSWETKKWSTQKWTGKKQ